MAEEVDSPADAAETETQNETRAVILLLACFLCFLWFRTLLEHWHDRAFDVERLPERRYEYRVDANSAGPIELEHLPGIGPTLAQRIIDDRKRNGPYRNLDDLDRVSGLGEKKIQEIAPYLRWPGP